MTVKHTAFESVVYYSIISRDEVGNVLVDDRTALTFKGQLSEKEAYKALERDIMMKDGDKLFVRDIEVKSTFYAIDGYKFENFLKHEGNIEKISTTNLNGCTHTTNF